MKMWITGQIQQHSYYYDSLSSPGRHLFWNSWVIQEHLEISWVVNSIVLNRLDMLTTNNQAATNQISNINRIQIQMFYWRKLHVYNDPQTPI